MNREPKKGPLSKRLAVAATAAFLALGLAAPSANADRKSDTLVWATDRENPITDPYFLNTRELVIVGHHVWDTLVLTDPATGDIKPLLATGWKWVNNTTLELELRQGVRFHSGKAFDADDVVYTLNFVANKENAIANYSQLEWIASAQKIDARRVRINLKRPFPPALAYLAGLGFIMPQGHYDAAPVKADGKKDFGAVKANGTGPYRITELKPGDYIHMTRNADYFKNGPKGYPSIGALRFRTIKDQNTRTAELMTGRIDWIWDVPKDQADRLKANPALVLENAKTLRVAYLAMDVHGQSGAKVFGDRRVRQALAHAINRELVAKTFMGPASSAVHAACHPDQFACAADVPRYEYSPDKARALLKEAGYPNGFEFNLYAYRDRELSEAVIGELVRVGLKPRLTYLQYTPWLEAVRKGAATVAHGTWGSNSIPDVSAITAHFFNGGPDDLVKDKELMKIIAEADAQTDPGRRRELWQKALARIAAEAYWVPLYTYAKYYAYSKDLDFKPTSDEMPQFYAARWR